MHVLRACPGACPGCPLGDSRLPAGSAGGLLPLPSFTERLDPVFLFLRHMHRQGVYSPSAPLYVSLGPGDWLASSATVSAFPPYLDALATRAARAGYSHLFLLLPVTGLSPQLLVLFDALCAAARAPRGLTVVLLPQLRLDARVLSRASPARSAYLSRCAAFASRILERIPPTAPEPDDDHGILVNDPVLDLLPSPEDFAGLLAAHALPYVNVLYAPHAAPRRPSLRPELSRVFAWVERYAQACFAFGLPEPSDLPLLRRLLHPGLPHPSSSTPSWPFGPSSTPRAALLMLRIYFDGSVAYGQDFLGDTFLPAVPFDFSSPPQRSARALLRLQRRALATLDHALHERAHSAPCSRCPSRAACFAQGFGVLLTASAAALPAPSPGDCPLGLPIPFSVPSVA